MCGIFFSIGFDNPSPSVIDSVIHRGPDGRGWDEFSSAMGSVIMAHRRLAIIDLSDAGHQPMASEDKRFWVTYNGEIYNYLEIRHELEKLGHYFKTKTDTEVLLKGYAEWGSECLHKFNGMFAFVIWDDEDKKIFAARDRFGVKPIYYYKQNDKLAFASEIKQFKHLSGWKNVLNKKMADEYLETNCCDNKTETLYENVFQLLPGEYLKLDIQTSSLSTVTWYNLKNISTRKTTTKLAISKFKELFSSAIKLRFRADVSVGACLSGGIDSTSIVSMLDVIHTGRQKIYTFSSVFPGHKIDESAYIDEIVSQKKLISYKNYPSFEDFLEKLDSILYHQDLPFLGTSVFAQWSTFQSAKKEGVTVLLDGQGADESLLGYSWMLNSVIFDYLKKLDLLSLYKFIRWQIKYNKQTLKHIFLSATQQRFPNILSGFLQMLGKQTKKMELKKLSTLNNVCMDHFYNNLQTLLRYEDRNSMAFSRESRLPFLDYRLVEFIFSLSVDKRLRGNVTKWILRESMRGINLDSILKRKDKIGFATPEQEWFQKLIKYFGSEVKDCLSFKHYIFYRWCKNNSFEYCYN